MRFISLCIALLIFMSGCGGGGSGSEIPQNNNSSTNSNSTTNTTPAPTLVKLQLTPSKTSIYEGDYFSISATGIYSDGSQKSEYLSYSTESTDLLSISGFDSFNAKKIGTAVVIGKIPSYLNSTSTVQGELSIEIKENVLTSLSFSGDITPPGTPLGLKSKTQSIFNVGDKITINVNANYASGKMVKAPDEVKFSSNNSTIATVTTNGTINALKEGDVQIIASLGGIQNQLDLTIVQPLTTPYFTINCSITDQKISASMWNTWRNIDPTNLYKWIAFDSATCKDSLELLLTSPLTNSVSAIYLAQKNGIMYRYGIPEATINKSLDIGMNNYPTGYTKLANIIFTN